MKLYWVDAFADRLFTGNPAAVCHMPAWLDDRTMQQIAVENNLSETAFLVKEDGYYAIRWFTPNYEIDLCGHATLASAFVIHQFIEPAMDTIRFHSKSGALTVKCEANRLTLNFPARPAAFIDTPKGIEQALGVPVQACYQSRDLVTVVAREEDVQALKPDFTLLQGLDTGDGVIVTAPGKACDFVSRCFYPKCGVNEDPVTGSAHCNLIPYWAEKLQKETMVAKQLSPRGGTLFCQNCGERVLIGGNAVLYAVAELSV